MGSREELRVEAQAYLNGLTNEEVEASLAACLDAIYEARDANSWDPLNRWLAEIESVVSAALGRDDR